MTDLERQTREMLEEEVRSAPPPHEAPRALRKTRRHQAGTVVMGLLAVTALVAASIVGFRAVRSADRGVPADQPTVMTTINGISITHPPGWYVVDPDQAGLNGPEPTPDLPTLVLALAPFDPGDFFACPGVADAPHTFLMTIQQEPLALTGSATEPWPVELEPLGIEDSGESGCYPGWESLRASWTAGGRTFEARMGFAPDASDDDRAALLAAFESMTFEPVADGATSVVLAAGTAGGEDWELIAEGQADGLSLMLQAETIGGGGGGFDPTSFELSLIDHVLGSGSDAERVVFGAVPADAVQIGVRMIPDDESLVDVVDVPDSIDEDLNAFLVTVDPDDHVSISAYDASGRLVATGEIRPGSDGATGTPIPSLDDVSPVHGGTYWGLYLWVTDSIGNPHMDAAVLAAENVGFNPSVGDIACDENAAADLGVPADSSRVAVYFESREEADAAAALFDTLPVAIAKVTTYCLD